MSTDTVMRFYQEIIKDQSKLARIQELNASFDGEELDESKRLKLAQEHILPLAENMGYSFSIDDLTDFVKIKAAEYKESGKLSEPELEAVAGGANFAVGVCVILGAAAYGPFAFCFGPGYV